MSNNGFSAADDPTNFAPYWSILLVNHFLRTDSKRTELRDNPLSELLMLWKRQEFGFIIHHLTQDLLWISKISCHTVDSTGHFHDIPFISKGCLTPRYNSASFSGCTVQSVSAVSKKHKVYSWITRYLREACSMNIISTSNCTERREIWPVHDLFLTI